MDPGRKHPAHPPVLDLHGVALIVFLTVCSKDRKPILAIADSAEAIINSWREAESRHVGRFVIMPDHIHLFCGPATSPPEPLKQWVRSGKTQLPSIGPGQTSTPFGSAISGTHNYDALKITNRSGYTLWITQSGRV
jgi:putative transposase